MARADDTGLGVQSWEACRALQPDAVLVVEMGAGAHRELPTYHDRYPGATRATFAHGRLPEDAVRDWLAELDVVVGFECFYDPDFYDWAEHARTATALQVNPELLRPLDVYPQRPSAWWAPTPWRLEHIPAGAGVVPVPVADDRFPFRRPERDGVLRVLHVEGHPALADRNGTRIVRDALRRVTRPMRVTMASQAQRAYRSTGPAEIVTRGPMANYWDLYADHDVLVLPRRYGGLSLIAQEAMASGLAVVMTDAEPQRSIWPILAVPGTEGPPVRMLCGPLRPVHADPAELAGVLDRLASDPDEVGAAQIASLRWAMENRWSSLAPLYRAAVGLIA